MKQMIIEAREDVVTLRGQVMENHWAAIAAAVDMLLPLHPQGILMDCSRIESITDQGGSTFINGLTYMEERGARIILCAIPDSLAERLRSIPGLQSQVPVAPTVEAGRQSLETARAAPLVTSGGARVLVAPVNPPFSLEAAWPLLSRLRPDAHTELHLVYAMVVPRSLPVGAPLPDEEARADSLLAQAETLVGAPAIHRHVVRGRNLADAIVEAATKLRASEIISGIDGEHAANEDVTQILQNLRQRTPCVLIVAQEPGVPPVA